jgi:hypothetical protein
MLHAWLLALFILDLNEFAVTCTCNRPQVDRISMGGLAAGRKSVRTQIRWRFLMSGFDRRKKLRSSVFKLQGEFRKRRRGTIKWRSARGVRKSYTYCSEGNNIANVQSCKTTLGFIETVRCYTWTRADLGLQSSLCLDVGISSGCADR